MSNIYLYFYKNQNGSNFFFHDSKDNLDSVGCFDALISELDLETWQSDSENYPNPQFPLPSYIIEGFKGPMYELLKESTDLAYYDLAKKNLKASIALFIMDNNYRHYRAANPFFTDEEYKEYNDFLEELKAIKRDFNFLNKLLKTINTIDELYEFQHSILPNGQSQRSINNICSVKKQNCFDILDSSISSINNDSDLSTKDGFTSDED